MRSCPVNTSQDKFSSSVCELNNICYTFFLLLDSIYTCLPSL
nr:MAG TPA: hypothetical protein [Caudoviricetes sp.]